MKSPLDIKIMTEPLEIYGEEKKDPSKENDELIVVAVMSKKHNYCDDFFFHSVSEVRQFRDALTKFLEDKE